MSQSDFDLWPLSIKLQSIHMPDLKKLSQSAAETQRGQKSSSESSFQLQHRSLSFSRTHTVLRQSFKDDRLSFQMQIQVVYNYTEKAVQDYDPVSSIILIIHKQAPHPNKESGGLTFTGFAILIQLQTRRTPAVETSDGVAAESLAASVGLLTLVHIWWRETKFILQSLNTEEQRTVVQSNMFTRFGVLVTTVWSFSPAAQT